MRIRTVSLLAIFSSTAVSSSAQNNVSSLSYQTPIVALANQTIINLSPNLSGNASGGYTISPSLPSGLTFNASTGIISGIATAASAATNYTITAQGTSNSTTFGLNMEITNNYFSNTYGTISFGGTGVTVMRGDNGVAITNTTTNTYGRSVGEKVVYKNVVNLSGTSIDCIVTTVASNVSSWTAYDQNDATGTSFSDNDAKFFSPQVNFPSSNGVLTFNFQFILGDSYSTATQTGKNVILLGAQINSYDIDGNGANNSEQSTNFSGFSSYSLATTNNFVTPTFSNGLTTFKSNTTTNTSSVTAAANRVRVKYTEIGNFTASMGGGGTAYFFLDFGSGPTFTTEIEKTAPSIDLNTGTLGVNNNNAGCGDQLKFTPNTTQNNVIYTPTTADLTQFSISFPTSEVLNGANEELWISGTTTGIIKIPLNSNFISGYSFTLGSVAYSDVIATTSGNVRTIVFKRSGTNKITRTQAEALLDAISYNNKAANSTSGARNFTVNVYTTDMASPDAIFTATVNCVALSGHIYHDVNGTVDGIVNAVGTQFTANQVYAVLVDPTTNTVLDRKGISAGGAFYFGKVSQAQYAIYVSTTAPTIGSTFTTSSFPTGYVATGENLGSGSGTDLSTDGKLFITLGSTSITEANFGLQMPPTTTSKTISNLANPGGFNYYTTPTNSFLTQDSDGQIDSITINSFPVGANYLKIGTVLYTNSSGGICPPQSTCTPWPGSVTVPFSGGNPTQSISVDPTVDGSTSVVINFKAWDNAKAMSNNSNLTLNFIGGTTFNTISGKVWNDANGDGIKAASEPWLATANSGETLYALLVQTSNTYSGENTILNSVAIDPVTGYSFSEVPAGNDYTIKIVSLPTQPGNGVKATTVSPKLANNWTGVSTNADGTIVANQSTNNLQILISNLTSSKSNLNFGIEQLPDSQSETVNLSTQPQVGSEFVLNGGIFPIPSGSDPEDGSMASGKTIKITSLPSNSNLVYNNIPVTAGQVIANFNPSLLKVVLTTNTAFATSTEFKFAYIDNASQIDPIPATYKINWLNPLPITFSSFTASANDKIAVLKWSTGMEQNNKGFEIERSNDAKSWEQIGFTPSSFLNGTSSTSSSYEFNDKQPLARNFYRIKQVDFDGNFEYSGVKTVIISVKSNDFTVIPNPTSGIITVLGVSAEETIYIVNALGKMQMTIKAPEAKEQIDLSQLAKGIYFIVVIDKNETSRAQKLIKE